MKSAHGKGRKDMADYKYLFPFEKVSKGSKVLIYGAGEMGWEYLRQLLITKYAQIIGVIDKKAGDIKGFPVNVYYPSEIDMIEFDFIVLAFRSSAYYSMVYEELKNRGVNDKKIVYVAPRIEPDYKLLSEPNVITQNSKTYAFEMDCLSIAIKLGSAIGDNIIQKKFIEKLISFAPSARIDIYSSASDTFLPWMYKNCKQINTFIQDGGFLYTRQCNKYDLSIQIWVFVNIDYIDEQAIEKKNVDFYNKIIILKKKINETEMNYNMPMFNFFARAIKQGKNAYTVYDFDGEFDIKDKIVNFIIDNKAKNECEGLDLPNKYITVNYGNGLTGKYRRTIAKQWPSEYFEKLINKFAKEYVKIGVVQLGAEGAQKLSGVKKCITGKPLNLVAQILKKSLLHIDIEGGLVHLATQMGTKCIVLFGPTQEEYFGYEENINIKAGSCHDCWGMYLDQSKCARHMEKPECMYSITPEIVMGEVKKALG